MSKWEIEPPAELTVGNQSIVIPDFQGTPKLMVGGRKSRSLFWIFQPTGAVKSAHLEWVWSTAQQDAEPRIG